MASEKVYIRQVRSTIGRPRKQKRTLRALGLRRLGQRVQHSPSPAIMGMLAKVSHLIDIQDK